MKFLSHWSAALRYGLPSLPDPIKKMINPFITHYTVRSPGERTSQERTKQHVCSVDLPEGSFLVTKDGEGIVSPELLFYQLCNMVPEITDAILIGCHMVSPLDGRTPLTTIEKLREFGAATHYVRGLVRGRDALQFLKDSFLSPPEVLTYLKAKLPNELGGCGYNGDLEVNAKLWISDSDRDRLGQDANYLVPDLLDRENKQIFEYDGQKHHSSPEDQARDKERRDIFGEMGYNVNVITKDILYKPLKFAVFHWELFNIMDRKLVINAKGYAKGLTRLQQLLPRESDPLTEEEHARELRLYCAIMGYKPRVR